MAGALGKARCRVQAASFQWLLAISMTLGISHSLDSSTLRESLALRSAQAQAMDSSRLAMTSVREKKPLWTSSASPKPDPAYLLPWEMAIHERESPGYLDAETPASPHGGRMEKEVLPPASTDGWRGYLSEKGPPRVIVVEETTRQPEALPDAIWALIQGPQPQAPRDTSERLGKNTRELETRVVDENREVLPSSVLQTPVEPEKNKIDRSVIDDESLKVDDAMETHLRLMQLFSTPIFAVPSGVPDNADGMISLNLPQSEIRSSVREGSRARFEIRR
jgi:hypothetical protein